MISARGEGTPVYIGREYKLYLSRAKKSILQPIRVFSLAGTFAVHIRLLKRKKRLEIICFRTGTIEVSRKPVNGNPGLKACL